MMRSILCRQVAAAFLAALAGAAWGDPAQAQQASLTLVPDVAVWNDVVEVRIAGTGCSGDFAPPVERLVGVTLVYDIDLLGCDPGSTAPFAATARIGPFFAYGGPFHVRVRTGSPPPGADPHSTVLDEVVLPVHEEGFAHFELPALATGAAPVEITTRVERTAFGVIYENPRVTGHVIELAFVQGTPIGIPPPYEPGLEAIRWRLGLLAPGTYDVRLFEGFDANALLSRTTLVVHDAARCLPSPTALCLGAGRFRVESAWTDFTGHLGVGHGRPLDGDGASGLLWFFAPDNVELTVKVLDGCGVNGHYWIFLASGSTVEYTVTVTDTSTGDQRSYTNASGQSAPLLTDTSAFPCGAS